MAKGMLARISVLEKAVGHLAASLGKVTAALSGAKDAPKKPRKPRQPREALGSGGTGGFGKDGLLYGAPGPVDPHYADAGKEKRGRRKKAEAAGGAGGEG